jgi:charged multivesicular body protein 6
MGSSGSKESAVERSPKAAGGATTKARVVVEASDTDRAVLELKVARDKLKKFRKRLDTENVRLTERAHALVSENQSSRAMTVLRLRQFKTTEADKVDKQLSNVNTMISNIEEAVQNTAVFNALKEGTQALNRLHSELTFEQMEAIMSDSAEAIEAENAISDALLGHFNADDDAVLQSELDAFFLAHQPEGQAAAQAVNLPAVPKTPIISLPAAPSGNIVNTGAAKQSATKQIAALAN